MKPIYPFLILEEELKSESWLENTELATNILHIRNVCSNFPSLLLGYSADPEAKSYSDLIINVIVNKWGINVFLHEDAVPLSALSYAITTRSMPIGLYIEAENLNGKQAAKVTLISTHGGLFNEQDLKNDYVPAPTKPGVLGTTDVLSGYIKQLTGFIDPFIEKGICFSEFSIPFKSLEDKIRNNDTFEILNNKQIKGPIGKLSNNGCYVNIYHNNELLSVEKLSLQLANYLKNERFASGSMFVPKGKGDNFSNFGELIENESESDLSYLAGFSDLFLGWWPEKLIALQGSSCFGDGILASIYFIESLR